MEYPFKETHVQVEVPRKFRAWFSARASLPVVLSGDVARVGDEPVLRVVPVAQGYAVLRGTVVVGEFDKHTVRRTLNDRLLRKVGVIRSAVYGVSFPAPLAYVLKDYSLVHPGPCFDRHSECITIRAMYNMKDEDARCCVCKESFV